MTVALPKQVQRDLEAADAMIAAAAKAPETTISEQTVQQAEQPAVVDVAPEPPIAQEPAPVVPELAELRQQLKTLQGKYDIEVPRLHELLKASARQRDTLVGENAALRQENEKLKQATPPVQAVTNDDVEAFGEDMVDFVRRVTRAEVSGAKSELTSQIEPLKQDVTTVKKVAQDNAVDRYWSAVESAVPDLEAINADSRWLAWLSEVDPVAGAKRQSILDSAVAALDVQRTLDIVKAWKDTQPAPAAATKQQTLESQVAPSRTSSSSPAVSTPRLWTEREYNAAFDPRKTMKMPPQEVAQLQAEADRAATEGRVQWGR